MLMGLLLLGLSTFLVPVMGNYFAHISQTALLKYMMVIFIYSTAIPYFYALYQTLLLLAYISHQNTFSKLSLKSLRYIKYCATIITCLYVLLLPIPSIMSQMDDTSGFLSIGFRIIYISTLVAVISTVLQVLLTPRAIKSKNDLTI